MADLEAEFHQVMANIYETAKRDCNYKPTYLLKMISEHGGLETAKRLLASDKPSEGFATLLLCGRLDLSVEAYVIQPKFAALFTPEEVTVATNRLKEYGYKFDDPN